MFRAKKQETATRKHSGSVQGSGDEKAKGSVQGSGDEKAKGDLGPKVKQHLWHADSLGSPH